MKLSSRSNSNVMDESEEQKEAEVDDEEEEGENQNDDDTDGRWSLPKADRETITRLFSIVGSFTATQLKAFLRNLKSLIAIDGEAVFADISMAGKKEELHKRIKQYLWMIYCGDLVLEDKSKWSYGRCRRYKETIDFDGWKLQIKQFLYLIASLSAYSSVIIFLDCVFQTNTQSVIEERKK